jgi:hypothetical protein
MQAAVIDHNPSGAHTFQHRADGVSTCLVYRVERNAFGEFPRHPERHLRLHRRGRIHVFALARAGTAPFGCTDFCVPTMRVNGACDETVSQARLGLDVM